MRFDRKKFFDAYRQQFGKLNALQVDGLNRLLNGIENDPFVTQIPEAAYLLATPKHETAHTFQPIHEYGGKSYFIRRYGGQTRKGNELGNDTPEEGYYYAGKGDVQLTGESNYEKAEVAIRREYPEVVADFERRTGKVFDLTIGDQANDTLDPQNALDPAISYVVMSYGMRTGMFTGRKLSEFIRRGKKDYVEARRTVNGKDKAQTIAGYAEKFEKILSASKVSAVASNGDSAALENQPSATDIPATTPSVQQPIESITTIEQTEVETPEGTGTQTILQKAETVGDKFQAFQSTLDKFGFSIEDAKRSIGTVLMTFGKLIFAGIMAVWSLATEHWEYLLFAALLIVIAYLLWDRSGKRVAEAKAGIPSDVAKEMIKKM